jgi:hypothetical protein
MTDELEFLRGENARLQRQLAANNISVLQLSSDLLPDDDEIARLLKITNKFDCLRGADPEQVKRAMRYLAFTYRKREPNTEFSVMYFLDECRAFQRRHGYATEVSLHALVAAAVLNDISYRLEPVELGLSLGSQARPQLAWRDVLERGKVLPPAAPKTLATRYSQHQLVRTWHDDGDDEGVNFR